MSDEAGKYLGKRSKGMLPKNYLRAQLVEVEQRGSKTIEWYDVWIKDPDSIRPVFKEDEEPKRSKVRYFTEYFTGQKIK